MNRISFIAPVILILCIAGVNIVAQEQLYQVKLVRAAPGKLLQVIELYKEDIAKYADYGIQKPYLMRHSQGDQWDLMFIFPIDGDYFSAEAVKKTNKSKTLGKRFGDPFFEKISSHQEAIFAGPAKSVFNKWFEEFGFYHVEIFTSLAGKQKELLKQREMENVYLTTLNRRPNFIFTKVAGPAWDIFTIGFYRDLKDMAVSGDLPDDVEDEAAKKAGFEGANTIGSYLRELILEHHDTLAGAIRNQNNER
jgi:hypothetical protein